MVAKDVRYYTPVFQNQYSDCKFLKNGSAHYLKSALVLRMNKMNYTPTVPTFNSCTEFVGSPGIKYANAPQLPPTFLGMDARITSHLNVALIRKLLGSLMFFAYILTCYLCMFVQPGTDKRPVDWWRN